MILKSFLTLFVLFLITGGYAFQAPYFTNTFDIARLLIGALCIGGALGFVLGKFLKVYGEDISERVAIHAICVAGGMIIFPLIGLYTNHALSYNTPLSTKVTFVREEPLITARFGITKNTKDNIDAFYTHFMKDGKIDRVRTKHSLSEQVSEDKILYLPIRKGFWGYPFVEAK
jgi:hypothetical protein